MFTLTLFIDKAEKGLLHQHVIDPSTVVFNVIKDVNIVHRGVK